MPNINRYKLYREIREMRRLRFAFLTAFEHYYEEHKKIIS